MSKVKCPKCGHMNSPHEEHCSNCGYSLKQTKEASSISFLQSMYKVAMSCPTATGNVDLNTKNRDKTIEKHNYGPLNLNDQGYWELIADKWNTTPGVAKKSKCGNCVAFDVSPRMDDCMPGPVSDGEGRLGYCWMHHFKCHSARTCNTWAKGGPIKKDEASHDWQKKAKGMEKEASKDSSVKSDILKAFKAEGGALGMKALKKHVKAPDVQTRLKDLMEEGRVYEHRHGDFIEKESSAAGEYDDSHMLSKILMRMSAQSAHLKEKIDAGLVIPSWAEYKLYNAYSSLGSALGTAYPGEYEKEAKMEIDRETPLKDRLGLRASYRPSNELGQGGGIGIGAGVDVDKERRLSVGGTVSPFGDAGMLSADYRLLPGKGVSPTLSLGTDGISFGLSNRGAIDEEEASTLENTKRYLREKGLMRKEARVLNDIIKKRNKKK